MFWCVSSWKLLKTGLTFLINYNATFVDSSSKLIALSWSVQANLITVCKIPFHFSDRFVLSIMQKLKNENKKKAERKKKSKHPNEEKLLNNTKSEVTSLKIYNDSCSMKNIKLQKGNMPQVVIPNSHPIFSC